MKTKSKEAKQFIVANNHVVVHNGTVYVAQLDDFNLALRDGADDDGYTIDDYASAKVSDLKKVGEAFVKAAQAAEIIEAANDKLEGINVFGSEPIIDSDGDLNIGCTTVHIKDAQAFLKQLA